MGNQGPIGNRKILLRMPLDLAMYAEKDRAAMVIEEDKRYLSMNEYILMAMEFFINYRAKEREERALKGERK